MKMMIGKIRESLDKLFLLGLFAAGLGIAQYLVLVRSRIELSRPVVLPDEGLSIRLPVSTGWQSKPEWILDPREQGYFIQAIFDAPSHKAQLWCGYRPYLEKDGTIQERLTQRAAYRKAQIIQVGERSLRGIQMNWVLAMPEQGQFAMFYGTGKAGEDRVVELEVLCQTDPDFARRIFMTVADGLRFKAKPPDVEAPNVTEGFDSSSGTSQTLLAVGRGE
jgi:hypothetical protein